MRGIHVIDMTSMLSGPFCTWLLSTLGQHAHEVLREIGYSDAEIEELQALIGI